MRSLTPSRRRTLQRPLRACALAAALALAAAAAQAQPFQFYLGTNNGTASGFAVPHNALLNPTGQITLEAWVYHTSSIGPECANIAGKGYKEAWWIGICSNQLRSYIKGASSLRTVGAIPVNRWTHVAVTYDGHLRCHYVDGELIQCFPETGPLTTDTLAMEIGSDVDYSIPQPQILIDEFRIWNVARTVAQIRSTINIPLTTAQPGLVAVYNFDPPGTEPIHGLNGDFFGGADFFHIFPGGPCISGAESLCLLSRFEVEATFRTGPPGSAESPAMTAGCPNAGSGLFWFFSPDNWELMVKAIDGCPVNSRYWLFSAATTNVFYRLVVLDVPNGRQRIYFNWPGPPAPAVTDTSAFTNCP
jgi:hypothetical protein